MCDCFHLAFPNWHGSPGTGAARRLKAPDPEDNSVCEEPSEFFEEERPRPQGSSPVNEFPANEKYTDLDKEREEELYDPDQKSSGGKKGRKVGFGSFFEKRSKMSQEEFPESGVIVKTPKKVCAEGLVVSGGGKEGIFIKEVKAESPAAKHLSVQEGDQILSATVYFENVSYEDALQILEHAQPYKMELCVKRKPPAASALEERQEVAPGEEESGPLERGRTKIQRRQDARISWPKFPSFTRGRKAHFKRSHSTSEAEEQRKLEMSPPTSDTESPMRTLEPAKDKKTKKQKMNLSKLKMKGGKSKSVEEQDKDSGIPISRSQENVQETQTKELLDINSPQTQEYIIAEPHIHVIDQQEKKETTRVRNEYNILHVSGPVSETSQHKAELISLDKTLKTADISGFLADRGSPSTKKTPEGKKKKRKERSELKVNIQGKEKDDSSPEGLLKSPQAITLKTSTEIQKTPDMEARSHDLLDKTVGPKVTLQTELKRSPIAADINAQRTDRKKSISDAEKISLTEKATSITGDVDIHLPKVDMSIDMSDVGLLQISPIKLEKQKKERSILIHDSERYGIRPRGPMADTSLTKKYLGKGDSNISKPKSPKMKTSLLGFKDQEITAIRKDASIRLEAGADIQCPQLEIQALKSPKGKQIDVTEKSGKRTAQKFKMPKIDDTDFNVHEPVMSDVKTFKGKVDLKSPTGEDGTHETEPERRKSTTTKQVIKIELLKREDIEIPGMESTDATGNLQTPSMKLPKTGKIDASVPTTEIQPKKIQADVKVDRIKDTTSMTFKLPKLDSSALEVHQPISKTDVRAKKVKLDLKADFSQPKTPEGEVKGQDHKIQNFDCTETGINYTSRQKMKTSPAYKIPRIDSPDPYVHEPISIGEGSFSKAKFEIQDSNMEGKLPMSAVYGRMVEISASHAEMGKTERPEIKLPNREEIEIPGMESSSATGNTHAIDIQLPGIGEKDASDSSMEIHVDSIKETITNINIQKFKLPKMDSDFDGHEQITKKVVNTEKAKSPKQKGKNQVSHAEGKKSKFKIPPMPEYDVAFPRLQSDELGKEKETGEMHCRPSSETQMGAGMGINADITSQSTDSQIKYIKSPNVVAKHTSKISQPDLEGLRAEINKSELHKDISHSEEKTKVKLARTQEEKSLAEKQTTGIKKSKTKIELQESTEMNAPIIKTPNMESTQTETNMSVSKSEISNKTSDFGMKTTSFEIKADISESGGTKELFQMPHIQLPTSGISQTEEKDRKLDSIIKPEIGSTGLEINTSGISIDENMPKCESPLSRDTPAADITSQCSKISAPAVNAEMKLENLEHLREESTFKVPRFVEPCTANGIETDPTAIDIKTSKNQTLNSKVETVATLRAVEMQEPSIEEKVEISDAKEFDMKTKKPKILLPASGFSKPDIDGSHPQEDASNEKLKVDVKGPVLDISASKIQADVKGEQLDTRGSSTTFKLPTVKLRKDSISATEIGTEEAEMKSDIIVPEVKKFGLDPEISDLHFEGMIELNKPTGKNVQSKTRPPGIDVSLPAVKDQDAYQKTKSETNNSFPTGTDSNSLDNEITGIPDAEFGGEAKFNIPHGQIPSFGPSELQLKSAEAPGDTSLQSTDVSEKKDQNTKGHEIRGPSMDAMGTDIKRITADQEQEHRFEPPKFGVSLPKLQGPKMNISKSDPDVDVSLPKIAAGAQLPSTEIKRSAINGTLDIPEVEQKVHKLSISFSKPSLTKSDTEATEMEADISQEATYVPEIGLDEDETGPEIESSGIRVSADTDNWASTIEVKPLTLKMPTIGVTVPTVKAHIPESKAEIKPASFNEDIDQDHAVEQGSKFELPKVKMPKMEFPQSASKGIQLEHDILPAKVEISGPETNIMSMESTVEGSSVGIRTKIPAEHEKFTLPQVKSSSFGFSKSEITSPAISGDEHLPLEDISTKPKADISATDTSAAVKSEGMKPQEPSEFEIKGSEVDLEGPDVKADIRCKEAEQEKVGSKLLKCGISLPKVKGPTVDVSASKPDVDISLPKATIDAYLPAVEVEKSLTGGNKGILEADSKGPEITVKKLSLSKFSKANVQAPDIDMSLPKEDVSLAVAGEEFKEVNTVSPDKGGKEDYDISGSPSQLKGTTIQLPKLGITTPKVKAGALDLSVEISLPETGALSGKAISDHERMGKETKKPEGTFEHPKTKVPTLRKDTSCEIRKGEYELPVLDSKIVLQDTEAEVKGLSLEGQVRIPDIKAGTGVEETFMMPHVKLPSVSLTKTAITAQNISGSLQVTSEEIAVKKTKTEFNIPINVTEPDVNISLPEVPTKAKCPTVEVKGQSVEGYVESPGIDSKDIDMKLKKPMISLPKVGVSKPEIIAPKISGSFNLSSVDIGETKPNAGINIPEMMTDVTATELKLPEADLTLSGETPSVDVTDSQVKIKGPEVDIDVKNKGIELEGQGRKFKLPKFGISLSKAKEPAVDIRMMKPDVDIAHPEVKTENKFPADEVEGPSGEGARYLREEDSKDIEIKVKIPKISFPKFGFSKPEMTAPKTSGSLDLPTVDIGGAKKGADINVPDMSDEATVTGLKLPDLRISGEAPAVDVEDSSIDIKGPEESIDMKDKGIELEGQGSKFKLQKLRISLPKAEEPAVDISVSKPDVDISLPEVTTEAIFPSVEVEGPSLEGAADLPDLHSKDIDLKGKKPKISFPKFGFSKPEITAPKISGSFNLPSVDIGGTKQGADIKVPDMSVDVTSPVLKLLEADLGVSGEVPAVDIKDSSIDTKAPDVDIDVEGKDIEIEAHGSKFKLPKFGISLPKVKGPALDISMSKPHVDLSLPEVTTEAKCPSVEVEGPSFEGAVDLPDLDSKDIDLKVRKQKISFPKLGFSKPEITAPKISGSLNLPSVDIGGTKRGADIKVPDMSVDVASTGPKLPEADLTVSGEAPAVDIKGSSIDIKAPELDIDMEGKGIEMEAHDSKFKLPKFGISLPKAKGPALDISMSKPDVDLSLPELTTEAKCPSVEAEGPSAEGAVDLPDLDSKDFDLKVKKPKISFPKFGFSKPEITAPKISGSFHLPSVDIGGTKQDANIKVPDMSVDVTSTGPKLPEADLTISGEAPAVDIKDSSIDIKAPELDIDMEGKGIEMEAHGSKFKLPKFGISLPKAKGPALDIRMSKPDVDLSLPEVTTEAKCPSVEVEGPSLEGAVDLPDLDSKDIDLKVKMPKISFPKFGFSKPEMTAPKISGSFNLPSVDIGGTKQGADIKVPDMSVDVTSTGPKLPEADLTVSGEAPAVDIKDSGIDIKAPELDIDMEGKGIKMEAHGSKFKLPKFGISLPKVKGPALDINMSKPQVDLSLPEVTTEAKCPSVEVEGPSLEGAVDLPDLDSKDINLKVKKPKISFPKFGFSKPEITAPKISGSFNLPSVDIGGTKPSADITVPDMSVDVTSTGLKLPEADLTVSGEAPGVDIKDSSIDIKAPEVDIDMEGKGIEMEAHGSKFKLPKFGISLPKAKGPALDISMSKPGVDLSLPEVMTEAKCPSVEVEGPSLEGAVDLPDLDSKDFDLKVKKPKISFPKFGFSKPEITAPKISGSFNLPSVDIGGTKQDANIKVPDMSVDVTSTGPKLPEADLTISGEAPAVDIKDSSIDIKAPEVDIDMEGKGIEMEAHGSKFKLPKFGISLPKAKGPALDIRMSKPDVDLSLPEVTTEAKCPSVEVEGPSLEGAVDLPDLDSKGIDLKVKMPKISFPKFGFSKPEITAPKISGSFNLPSVDIGGTKQGADIKVPDMSVDVTSTGPKLPEADLTVSGEAPAVDIKDSGIDIKAPELDIDMEGKGIEMEAHGSKFKLPKFGISLPKVKGPALDINMSKPQVDLSLPEVTTEAKCPSVEVEGPSLEGAVDLPDLDSKDIDLKVKKPKISFPKFGFSKPEITAPKISGSFNLPSVDIGGTKPSADITVPDMSVDVTSTGLKLPEGDLTVSGEAPGVDIKDSSIAIKAPEVDIDMEGKGIEMEAHGSKFKLPKFGISLPKAKGPALDISVSKPDVGLSLPEVTTEAQCPSVEVEGPSFEGAVDLPDLDSKDIDLKAKKPKISFPKFGFSKPEITAPKISGSINLPSVDIGGTKQGADIKVPDMSVDVTSTGLKLPEADLTVSGEVPAVDIKDSSIAIKAPEVDIDMEGKGIEMEAHGSKFKLPKFGISLPKAKGPALDISMSKPDVDLSLPEVTTEAKCPSVEVEGPSLEGAVDLPDLDSKGIDLKVKKPKISFPKFGFSKPEITAPKISGSFNLPSVDIGGTKQGADIKVPDMSVDVTSPVLKLPEADLGVSGEVPAVDIKDSSIDIKAPEADIDMEGKGIEMEAHGSKFKLPKFGISLPKAKGPALDISMSKPDVDLSLPEVTTEAKCPSVEVEGPSLEGAVDLPDLDSKDFDLKVKMPKISFPKFGFSKPEITAPKISGSVNLPSVDIGGAKPSADIKVPDMSVDVTSTGLKLPEADFTVSGEAPAVDIKDSGIDIKAPEVDTDMEGKGIEMEAHGSKFKLPKFGITLPKAKGPALAISMSKPDVDLSLPEVTTEAKCPSVEAEGPSLEGAVDSPDLDSKDIDLKAKKPKISFPKFGFSKPEITAPKISGSVNLPSVDISGTKQGADIKVPDMSVDVISTGLKLPEADLTVSGEVPAVDIKDSSIAIKAPEVDIDMEGKGIEMEAHGSKFKLPKFGISLPKSKGPALDISMSKPDVDLSLPEVMTEAQCPSVEVEGPSLEGAVDLPDLDSKGIDLKVKKPKISFPKFGFSKPEITAPKISGSFNLPSVDIDGAKPSANIKVPDMSVDVTSTGLKLPEADFTVSGEAPAVDIKDSSIDIKAPEVDIDMEGKGIEMEAHGSKFKLPKFGISLPKAKGPALDISMSKPDVDLSLPEVTTEAKCPSVEVEGPSLEGAVDLPDLASKDIDLKVKMPKISFPKFGFSKPEITAPKISGSFNLPSVDIGGAKPSADIKVPDMSVDVTSTGLKLPEADFTVSGEAPAVDIKDSGIDLKAPEVDTDMEGKGIEMEAHGSKFKLPKFGITLPKAKGPALDISMSKPGVDLSLPEVSTEAKCPSVEVEGPSLEGAVHVPDLDSKGIDFKVKKSKISFPKFGFSKPEITAPKISGSFNLPSVDIGGTKQGADIKVPDMSVDVTPTGLKLPEADLTVSGEVPAVDIKDRSIDIKAPEVDIDMKGKGIEMEAHGSKFKLPKFGISLPKAKGPALDISVSKPDFDLSLPEVKTEAKCPSVEVEGPSLEGAVDLPDLDSKDIDLKVRKPKISLPKFGFSKPEITAPKISGSFNLPSVDIGGTKQGADIRVPDVSVDVTSTGLKIPEADLTVSGGAPAVDIKDSSIDIKAPELDIDMEGKGIEMEAHGSKFKLPKFGISLPKAKGPALDISVSKPGVVLSLPEVKTEAKCPSVEVEGTSFEGAVDLPDLDSKDIDLKAKKPKISFPKFGFSKPELTAPKISGSVNLPSVDIGGTKQGADIKVPDMSVDVTSTGLKLPEADLTVSGEVPAVDIKDSSIDIKAPEVDIDMEGKGIKMEAHGSKFKLPKFGISLPKAKGPALDISMSKPDVDLSLPEVTTEAKCPSVEVEGPSLEGAVDLPDLDSKDIDLKVKMPKISFPKFGFSKPEITAPKISGSFNLPSVDIGGAKPSADIKVPDMSVDVTPTGLKLPEADLTVSGEVPAVDIKDSSIDIKAPEVDIDMEGKGIKMEAHGSKFKLPKFGISLPKAKGPALDISMSKPDVDLSLPEVTTEAKCPSVEVEGPSLEGAVDLPDLDSKDIDLKVKMPKISFPKFGFSKPEITAPKISGSFNLPSVDIGGAKPSADIKVPDMSVDVTSTGLKLPEADLTVSGEVPALDIKDRSINIKAPEVDIDMKGKGIEMEAHGSKFKLPKFGISLPKAKGPVLDISMSKPDFDLSLPEVTTEAKCPSVEVEGPSLEGAVDLPDLDSKGIDLKVKKSKISFPKFGFSKPEITAPKISGSFNLPSVDIGGTKQGADIKVPDMSVDVTSTGLKIPEADLTVSGGAPAVDIKDSSIDIKAPELDIDMEGKGIEMEAHGSKFKLPKFGISLPKAKGPALDISVSKPDVDLTLPEVTTEAKCPSVEVEGPSLEGAVDLPDLDSKGIDLKVKKPKISFPKFGFSKPEITAPKISGSFNLPSVDIGGTKQGADIKVSDMSVDVTSTGLKLPEADLTVSGEAPAVEIKDNRIDIKAPEVDIEMKDKGIEMEAHGSKFKLPKFGISLPKAKGPALDISMSKPDVDLSLPELTTEAKCPSVEVEGPSLEGAVDLPDLDSKDIDLKVKKSKISFPKFGFSKPEITAPKISGSFNLPSVDISGTKQGADIKVPDMSVDVTPAGLKLPEADLTVSGEVPAVDIKDSSIDIRAPELDIDMKGKGIEMEAHGSKFKLPKFGISLPKAKGPALDISVSKPDFDLTLPEVTTEAKCSSVEVEGPSLEGAVDLPDLDSKDIDLKVRKPKISFPKFGFSKPEITAPKISGSFNLPSVDIGGTKPSADIKVPDMSVNVTSTGLTLPEADLTVSGGAPAVDIKDSSIDIKAPEVDIDMKGKGIEMEAHGSKFKLPNFGISLPKAKGPALDISVSKPDVDLSLPEVTTEAKCPSVEVEGPSLEGEVDLPDFDSKHIDLKVKKSKISFPKFGFSKPDVKVPAIDINLPKGDIYLPAGSIEVSGPDSDITAPETQMEIKDRDIDIISSPTKFKLPTIKFPKFGITGPKITAESPDIKVDIKSHDPEASEIVKVDIQSPFVETDGSSQDMNKPIGEVGLTKIQMSGIDVSLPKDKGEIKAPDMNMSLPDVDVHLPESNVIVKGSKEEIKTADSDASVQVKAGGSPSRFHLPSFKLPKFGITGSKIKAEIPEVSAECTQLERQSLSGKVDFKHTGQNVDMEKTEGKFDTPKVKVPDISFSLPKAETVEAKLPHVEAEGPSAEVVGTSAMDSKEHDSKVKAPMISFAKFRFSKPDIKNPDADVNLPTGDISLTAGTVEVKGPEVDIEAPETKTKTEIKEKDMNIIGSPTKFKLPSIKFPTFGVSAPKAITETSRAKINITEPEVETSSGQFKVDANAPNFDIEMTKVGIQKTKSEMLKMETPGIDVSSGETINIKDADITGPETEGRRFKLPKFRISFQKSKIPGVDTSESQPDDICIPEVTVEAQPPRAEIKGSSVKETVEATEVDSEEVDMKVKKSRISLPKFGFSKQDVKSPEIDANLPKADISRAEGIEVKGPEEEIVACDAEILTEKKDQDMDIFGSPTTFKFPTFKFPTFGKDTSPKSKVETREVTADITAPEVTAPLKKAEGDVGGFEDEVLSIEIGKSESTFKSSKLKMTHIDISHNKDHGPKSKPEDKMSAAVPQIKTDESELEAKGAGLEATVDISDPEPQKPEVEMKGSPSRFKLPSFKMPKFGFSATKAKTTDIDVGTGIKTSIASFEGTTKEVEQSIQDGTSNVTETDIETGHADEQLKSPTWNLSAIGDVFKGFDLEFNVPTLEEVEETLASPKTEVAHPEKKQESTEKDSDIKLQNNTDPGKIELSAEVSVQAPTITSTDKGIQYKLPKFGITSPSKTIKDSERAASQPTEDIDCSKKRENEEEDVSMTASVRSSDAFADISSTVVSEHPDPLDEYPAKVKVKISEPTASVGVSEVKVPTGIITSTARTELILLEHHLPDTVNIPVSSEATLTSPDDMTQETEGDIHVVTSNIQATPSSEHAKVITKYETRSVQAFSQQKITVEVNTKPWTIEESADGACEPTEENILVEKHMLEENSGDDKGAVIIKKVTQIAGATSGETIEDDAASAIRKLRDTMHSEKMKFFEGAETSSVTVSTCKIEKHSLLTSTEKKSV